MKHFWLFCLFHAVYSDSYFCKFRCGKDHTVCKREPCSVSSKCGKGASAIRLDDESRKWVVDIHNKYRSELALGQDPRGGNGKAANMEMLNYDKELEYVAQCWANACAKDGAHDTCRTTKKFRSVGQNMYSTGSTGYRNYRDRTWIEAAIKSWYEEIKYTTAANIDAFQSSGPIIGHFTQLVWATSTNIGCGRTQAMEGNMNTVYIYCNYGPGGNILTRPVYQRGEPCSKCGPETCNSTKYPGLCGILRAKPYEFDEPVFGRSSSAYLQRPFHQIIVLVLLYILLENTALY